jgi:hypothetical protein
MPTTCLACSSYIPESETSDADAMDIVNHMVNKRKIKMEEWGHIHL